MRIVRKPTSRSKMALTKVKKDKVVAEVAELLAHSKMTVIAQYQGTTVKAIQALRKDAKANGTKISVVKNRLVIKAIEATESIKNVDTSALKGQLLYAFNATDEVAPASALATFAKTNPSIQFVGAITADGTFMSVDDVKALAALPSKNDLIAQVVATLLSPVHDVTNALSGNLHALLDGISGQAA